MTNRRPVKSGLDLNNKCILYIDDDYVNYLYFSELLSGTGAVLERVYNPDQALLKLLSHRKVCLVMVMSDFIQRTRSTLVEKIKEIAPGIPVIGIMESENKELNQGSDKLTCDVFLSRQIDDTHLIETVSELLI